ncbi:MAG TPA: hypothetical protein VLX92_23845, partial [Kofleriaceae bacterium]|nr:hypothetical protein [Kofleriaceae bacterium]
MPAPERHLASHVFNVIVLCAAAAGFAWMIHTTGLHTVRAMVSDIGWGFGGIIALDLAATCCDAGAIQAFMRPEARMVSYWRVVAAQASGRAVNIFIPGGAVGETTKVTMLVGHAPRARVVSAIVLFNLAALYLAVAVVAIGVPITLALVDLPHEIELTLWIALGVVVALMIGLGVLVHRGALGSALGAARGLHLISAERAER